MTKDEIRARVEEIKAELRPIKDTIRGGTVGDINEIARLSTRQGELEVEIGALQARLEEG